MDGAIHRKGGSATITQACVDIRNRQGSLKTGESVLTIAGNLPDKYVIHTVDPVWSTGDKGEKNYYLNATTIVLNWLFSIT